MSVPQWAQDAWQSPLDASDKLFLTKQEWKEASPEVRGPWQKDAYVREREELDPELYARGYHEAARLVADFSIRSPNYHDYLALPIVFLYRHSIELYLKRIIPAAADLVHQKVTKNEKKNLNTSHNLLILWKMLEPRLRSMHEQDASYFGEVQTAAIGAYIKQLSQIDPGASSFRYATAKGNKNNLPGLEIVNIVRTAALLERFTEKLSNWAQIIDEQYQHDCEAMAEAGYHFEG